MNSTRHANRIQETLLGAPEEVLQAGLSCLQLTPGLFRRLSLFGIHRIGDLALHSDQALLGLQGVGVGVLGALQVALEGAIRLALDMPGSFTEKGPTTCREVGEPDLFDGELNVKFQAGSESKTIEDPDDLMATLNAFFEILTDRQRAVLMARMGFRGDPMTLEELGSVYNISRERVRQIQKKVLGLLGGLTQTKEHLDACLTGALLNRSMPLYLATLPTEDEWLRHIRPPESVLGFLIGHLLESQYGLFWLHGRRVVSRIGEAEWDRRKVAARSFVADNASQHLSESTVRLAVEAIAGTDAGELAEELWLHGTAHAHFAEMDAEDGECFLVAYGRGVEQMVTAVLEKSAEPLHYTEISRKVEIVYGAQDIRRVHTAATNVAILLGRGTFGIRRHIPVSADEAKYIVSLCESRIQDGPEGRQWHARELLAEIAEDEPLATRLNHYMLSALLRTDSTLHYVGRQVWTDRSHGRGGVYTRIDISNAIEAVLEKEGRPLAVVQIHKRISMNRGLGHTFQVHPKGRVIRVGAGVFGLLDRDVSISQDDLTSIYSRLEEVLEARKRALHVSEILTAVQRDDLDPAHGWQIFGASQCDHRFRFFPGDFLCLAHWTETKRLSVPEAIESLLGEIRSGATLDSIKDLAEPRLERSVSLDTLRAALRNCGASYDRASGRWFPPEDAELYDEEGEDANLAN